MLLKTIFLFLVFWILVSCFLFYCWVDKPFCAFTARSRLPHIEMVMCIHCFLLCFLFFFTHRSVNKNFQRLQTNSRKIEWSNPALWFLRRLFTIVRCILVSCFTNACQSAKLSRFKWLRLFVVIIVFIKQDCLAIICNLPFSHMSG